MTIDPRSLLPAGSARFSGRYVRSFEVSWFVAPGGGHELWWVDPAAMSGLPALEPDERGDVDAHVIVAGWLSVPGRYGHLGGYARELRVHRIIAAGPYRPEDHGGTPPPAIGRPIPWVDAHVPTTDVGDLSRFLRGTSGPPVAEVVTDRDDLVRVLEAFSADHPRALVARVRGPAVVNRFHLFDALRAGLDDGDGPAPLDWEAMAERLSTVRARAPGPIVVAVLDAEELLLREVDEFEVAIRHLRAVAGVSGTPFHVLLHTTERFGSILRSRLDRAGGEVPRILASARGGGG